ncbi:MAG: glycosyltransferase family 2 protein [Acidobacteria bacterium]|nr:glycosyltransferase family 2 protein [Acidobacteriota bacterium]
MNTPLFQFLIPTYKRAAVIGTTLHACLSQTIPPSDYEVVVVDNASPDETESVVRSFAGTFGNLKFIRNSSNLGMTGNWNRCLDLASASLFAIVHSDDVPRASYAESALRFAAANPEFDIAFGNTDLVDSLGRVIKRGFSRLFPGQPTILNGRAFQILTLMSRGNPVAASSAVFQRSRTRGFLFHESTKFVVDMEAWLRWAKRQDAAFGFLPETILDYVISEHQATSSLLRDPDVWIESPTMLLETYRNLRPSLTREEDLELRRSLAIMNLEWVDTNADWRAARSAARLVGRALITYPYRFTPRDLPVLARRLGRRIMGARTAK